MLLCTLLTFAMCADPNVPAAVAIGSLTVPIVWTRTETRSCMDLGRQGIGGAGDARMQFLLPQHEPIRIIDAHIELTAYHWPKMSKADGAALRQQYRATLWHEIGHFVTAQNSIDTTMAAGLSSADAFRQIGVDQENYDAVTAHGVRQSDAPPGLAGANTIIICTM
jgi:hypothetical protein